METNELQHYGVKGMKWGVRRPTVSKGKTRKTSSDFKATAKNRKKKLSELSNKELKSLNERLQLEKTNSELQSRGALLKIKKGTAAVGTVLAVGTTITTIYNLANSPAAKAGAEAVKKVLANR